MWAVPRIYKVIRFSLACADIRGSGRVDDVSYDGDDSVSFEA